MEEQVSNISDLEGLNSELEGFLSDLHDREESLSVRVRALEEELAGVHNSSSEKDALLKEVRAAAKQDASRAAAVAEDLRASFNNENSRATALGTERENLLRQLAALTDRLEGAKASVAEKEALLREASVSSKQDAAKFSATIGELRASLNSESSRASSITLERDDLARRLQGLTELLEETKGALAEKDTLMKEARASTKEKATELSDQIDRLKASLAEEGVKVAGMVSERDELLIQLKESAYRLEEAKTGSSKKDILFNEARAASKEKAAELSGAIDQMRASLLNENARVDALVLERDGLLRRLEGEKARVAEKELLINGVRTALKYKEEESEKVLLGVQELKADLMLERANLKDRESHLQKALKLQEGLERRLEKAIQENSRSEEGYLLKVELVKKELREQVSRAAEIERKLAGAGVRLDDALEEAGEKEKMLAEATGALAEKNSQLRTANLKLEELAKEFSEVKSGSGRENAQRSLELAASMAARVEELETAVAESSARSLEKYRASQAELSGARAALRGKEEENASLKARENSLIGELGDAEEKWKLASAQLHNAASRLRNAENENEITLGKMKFAEEERDKFRAELENTKRGFVELGRGQSAGAPGYIPDFEELVAGVAHQVANSISIIRSHAEFCAETPEAEGARESLGVIVRNIVNLQKKIDVIMNFSRPVIPQRSPERLAAVISEVLDGLRASGRLEKIKVSLKGGENLKPVGLDRVRFASAVEHLLLNAVEAMPGGGELSVSLSGGSGRQRIEVADTGAGVEKKNQGSIFHPFFTTRPGKMGLGLTLARNVVRAHDGTLELLSEPGKGATAVLELPEI